jgi:hypothetical protein
MGKKYHNFDLFITQCGDNYIARVINSPAGEARHSFVLPFSLEEIQTYLEHFNQTRTILLTNNDRQEKKNLINDRYFVGKTLYECIFTGDIEDVLQRCLVKVALKNEGLRLNLRLTEVPELINLPWEYLYDESKDYFFALSVNTPIVRYLALEESIKPAVQELPLKILIVIASPMDYPDLNVDKECQNIQASLGELVQQGYVEVTLLRHVSLADLQNTLSEKDYHIFHFIGHGGFNPENAIGDLVFEDQDGKGHAVSGKVLAMLLHDVHSLRLAILNACEGAKTSPCNTFSGVGQCLMKQGMPAVIAMQNEITDTTALIFAKKLYTCLVRGDAVDVALVETRKAISAQSNGVEWGIPVLYMRPGGHYIVDEAIVDAAIVDKILPTNETVETSTPIISTSITVTNPYFNRYAAQSNTYTFKPTVTLHTSSTELN